MTKGQVVGITIVVVLTLYAVNWVRQDGGFDWSISHVLPLMGGHPVSFYDLAGVALIVYALSRIMRGGVRTEYDDTGEEDWEYEDEWDEEEDEG